MTPLIKIEKRNLFVFGIHPSSLREELINAFSIGVPNYWFAKQQMKKKALRLRAAGDGAAAQSLEARADNWDGTKKFIYDYKTYVRMPSGLINEVINFFYQRGIGVSIQDEREFLPYSPNAVELGGIELRPYQQQAAQIMAEKGCGVLLVGTSGGKTEISAGLIKKFGTPRTVFLTHRNLLETQSQLRLQKRLEQEVGLVGGELFDPKQVTVAMVPTLYNRLKDKDKTIINFLKAQQLVIGDEIHLGTSDSWMKVFRTIETCNVYGMSGTPWKMNVIEDKELMSVIGPEIFRVPTKWLIDNGYVTPPIIKVVPYFHTGTEGLSYDDVIQYHVVQNSTRNNLVQRIVELDTEGKTQTLILVNIIEHGQILYDMLKHLGAELIHSKMKRQRINQAVEDFGNRQIKLLISTPLLDVGVDIPVLDRLILSGGGKAITTILQRIGRSLRISEGKVISEVFDIFDINQRYLSDHARERVLIYSDENQQFDLEVFDIGKQLPEKQEDLF